jgi:regulator of nucleoside diphosphate kinase
VDIRPSVERTLTHSDHARLARMLARQPAAAGAEALQDLIDASDLVAGSAAPTTLVTMNAQVLLQPQEGPPRELTLCYPEEARPADGLVSVLSPVGASLLGLRVGETASWCSAAGQAGAARIVSVLLQPEAHAEAAPATKVR